ncbi:MAG: DNA circularization N-terminal domain-containing protein [Chloroflexi bacterium]|nr:DNA circularization N-terminal domain-containing protein [Chloroflexota bacterium]
MASVYFEASFGGIAMLVSTIETERGRDIVVQSPAQGDHHTLTDHGKRLVRTTCEILFVDQPGQPDYFDRYAALVQAFEDGETKMFTHALDGNYRAKVENLTTRADSTALEVAVSAVFLRDDEALRVFPVAPGVNPAAGVEAVSTAVGSTLNVLDEFELESGVPALALEEITRWSEADDLDSQDVFVGVASLTAKIDEAIEELELLHDLTRWEPYKQMIALRFEVVRAGEAFTSSTSTVFDLFVAVPQPVLAICAEVYGAADARDFAAKVTKANRLRTPGRVPAGTTLKMPAVSS